MVKAHSAIWCALACLGTSALEGAGFGLYEMDAKATGMGGHVVGTPVGPSTVYYNPAGMSCLTGTCISVSGTFLHPPVNYSVWGEGISRSSGRLDAGWFAFPTVFVTQELPWGFHFGLGIYADFGLGSKYDDTWALKYDSVESTFQGFTLNPAVSWKVPWIDGLSVAGGLRCTYVSFETAQIRNFNLGQFMPGYPNYGKGRLDLTSDNLHHLGLGFNVGLRYEITEDLAAGVMFRSPIKTEIEGDAEWNGAITGGKHVNGVSSDLWLPGQVTIGLNWERAFGLQDLHFGCSGSWIEWSKLERFVFNVYNPVYGKDTPTEINLQWHDTLRIGFGFSYDVTAYWEALAGYVYDLDPSHESKGLAHTMLPPGDRHVVSFGLAWHTLSRNWEIALAYAPIIMQHSCADFKSEYGSGTYHMDTETSVTHCINLTLTYRF